MRYETQSPQYLALMEKIEKQEERIKGLLNNYDFACQYNKLIVESLNSLTEQIEEFEALPWYKRMSYKFKI